MNSDVKKGDVARKNDLCRRTFTGCRVVLTAGVEGDPNLQQIIKAVQQFEEFTEDNDPYGERDFGKVTISGEDYSFKFDYFDDNYEYFKEDGNRVLTILHSDEY